MAIKVITKSSKSEDTPDTQSVAYIESLVREYDTLRSQAKSIKKRMDTLASTIKDYAELNGVKNDSGSFYITGEAFIFGKQAKKSITFEQEKAISFLAEKGFSDCIKTTQSVDEDAVEARVVSGDITFDDLESITKTSISYAVDIKGKEEIPQAQQTTFSVAASRKPSFKKGR